MAGPLSLMLCHSGNLDGSTVVNHIYTYILPARTHWALIASLYRRSISFSRAHRSQIFLVFKRVTVVTHGVIDGDLLQNVLR